MAPLTFTDHWFSVPLDHTRPDGERIRVYAREVRRPEGERLPWLLFLNGGPGFPSPRPMGDEGWLLRATEDYRVLLLDQRGTGRSTPFTRHTIAALGEPAAQADHLVHFRADSIVLDAELIRRELTGDEPWSVLGQSFGGFCTVTYLSFAPEGLREAFTTGGLPGIDATADEVYRHLYDTVAGKNERHFARHPGDADQARRIVDHLRDHEVRLPSGRVLTVELFQYTGHILGGVTGSRLLHYLIEDPFAGGQLTDAFLREVDLHVSWASAAPLYSLLHEATYAQGDEPTGWSAQRVRDERFAATDRVLFTGEMMYPWMFDNDPLLAPMRETAHLLAARHPWPPLYDPARLAANTVPLTAAVYADDMYVARELSLRTAEAIRGARVWLTEEYEHDGLRVSNGAVLDRLLQTAQSRP